MRKKKHEEEKNREYTPETETTASETEEEMETAIEATSSECDVDDLTIDTQPFISSEKKSKKALSKPNALDQASKMIKKSKRQLKLKSVKSIAGLEKIDDDDDEGKKKNGKKRNDSEKERDGKNSLTPKDVENRRKVTYFNDKNIDVNLHNDAPQNIKVKRIKLSQSLLVICQMIDGSEMKGNFNNDFAALTFQKKLKDGKAFEFSIPLALVPSLQKATVIMVDANPQFFSGVKKFNEN